jgi:hypothetical protein
VLPIHLLLRGFHYVAQTGLGLGIHSQDFLVSAGITGVCHHALPWKPPTCPASVTLWSVVPFHFAG